MKMPSRVRTSLLRLHCHTSVLGLAVFFSSIKLSRSVCPGKMEASDGMVLVQMSELGSAGHRSSVADMSLISDLSLAATTTIKDDNAFSIYFGDCIFETAI